MTFSPITLGSGLAGYNYIARTREQQQDLFDRTPLISREVGLAADKLEDVETAEQLMADRTLLKVALGAFGLDEDINNKAFIQRILESDLGDQKSLANRLSDKRYLALAEAFNFEGADGPKLPNAKSATELTEQLQAVQSPQDLLSDRRLLEAALDQFGLEDNISNTYYLQLVLESDLSDPTSFANATGDDNLVDFARAFDFFQKEIDRQNAGTPLDDLARLFSGTGDVVSSADELIADPVRLEAALGVVGLDDIYGDDFLRDVLNSDMSDESSFANTQSDGRFAALAAAFNFVTPQRDELGDPVLDEQGDFELQTGTLRSFIDIAAQGAGTFESADDFFDNRELRDATFELLGIDNTLSQRNLARRVLDSDLADPSSFANLFPDPRFSALSDLISVAPPEPPRTYPDGFVDQVVRNYLDRQFEIQVGEVDPDMRVALGLERELNQVVKTSSTNDAQWFSIMSSPPLRQVFEGAFRLPSSFGSIDIDQQLVVLKDRSEQFFNTQTVTDFLEPETMDTLRQDYLLSRITQSTLNTSGANAASIILSNFA